MPTTRDTEDCAAVWFAILERAKNLNDFDRAAEAQRKLRELGVIVAFEPRTKGEEATP